MVLYVDTTGAPTSIRRDTRGLVTEIVDPRGGRTTYAYDDHGNCTSIIESNGARWHYRHDGLGRRIAEVDPTGAETRYAYSTRGDLAAIFDAAGGVTRYSYDGERHLTQVIDPKGGVTTLVWGGYHKLCLRRDANGHEVRLGYNLEGELVEVRNERDELHRLEYGSSGRLIREVTFDGRTLHYRHDALGRPVAIANGLGQETKLTYDLAGQVVSRELWDGSIESFEHDLLGRLVRARWPGGELRFERDALGRTIREVQVVDGEEHTVEGLHDAVGNRIGRRTSLGYVEHVERNASGARRCTVLDETHVIEHETDLLGRELARALPYGGRVESTYDAVGRLSQRRALGRPGYIPVHPGEPAWVGPLPENVTIATSYQHDLAGELVVRRDRRRGQTSYQYDPLGELLAKVHEGARAELFQYDPAGNISEAGADRAPRNYGQGSRLLQSDDAAYRWDGDGRLLERRRRDPKTNEESVSKYRWNAAGLLRSVTAPDGTLVEFEYDPFARRLLKRVSRPARSGEDATPSSVTRFVWDGDTLVHEITRTTPTNGEPVIEVRGYCFEDDGRTPLAHWEEGSKGNGGTERKWYHYVNDPIGTPERLIAGDGEVACELSFSAWGKADGRAKGRASTPLRLPGQYEDTETGLHYNRWRFYDPVDARYISPDPIGLRGGLNAFACVRNTLSWLDPFGLTEETVTAYRVEGPGNQRLFPTPDGRLRVEGEGMLFVNFGDSSRAQEFLRRRHAQGHTEDRIVECQVPRSFVDRVRSCSITERELNRMRRTDRSARLRPLRADRRQAEDQFGLRAGGTPGIEDFEAAVIPGSVR